MLGVGQGQCLASCPALPWSLPPRPMCRGTFCWHSTLDLRVICMEDGGGGRAKASLAVGMPWCGRGFRQGMAACVTYGLARRLAGLVQLGAWGDWSSGMLWVIFS